MGARFNHYAQAFCAAAVFVGSTGLIARADPARNCPKFENQSVIISKAGPTAFRLNVTDLGSGSVSIFSYPLGGILEQGPTPLDFIFIPEADFGGSTTFTYRLTPPVGCQNGALLGKVTLAGGIADGTDVGLNEPPKKEPQPFLTNVCGTGLPLYLPFTASGLIALNRRRRRSKRVS